MAVEEYDATNAKLGAFLDGILHTVAIVQHTDGNRQINRWWHVLDHADRNDTGCTRCRHHQSLGASTTAVQQANGFALP